MDNEQLARVFVVLADTMVDSFDAVEFLHTLTRESTDLLKVDAAGLMLTGERGRLQLVAASSEQARLMELFQLQAEEGPCMDSYRTGEPVVCADLQQVGGVWPKIAPIAMQLGFASVAALPMRLRGQIIGALNLFSSTPGPLSDSAMSIGQSMADVATIAILHERAAREHDLITEQLQTALRTRTLVEQAKGILAATHGLSMDDAFDALRAMAHSHRMLLRDYAAQIVDGTADLTTLQGPS